MNVKVFDSKAELGRESAQDTAYLINQAIQQKGFANIILATGASQFETLENLVNIKSVNWPEVVMFHLDEYVGMPESHPASFRKYLKERFIEKVPDLKSVYFIHGDSNDPHEECNRLNRIISSHPIDVALVGIGENGHLAFNDPPADFSTEDPYIVVELDEACRKQQMGEGWFKTFDSIPKRAISMSIRQIIKSRHIICSVPEKRKADAVKNCLERNVSNLHPASILQNHSNCTIYLDNASASLLSNQSNTK